MTSVIRESLFILFLSMTASALFAPVMINLLYRFGQVSTVKTTKLGSFKGTNALFRKIMNVEKINGTPNMGGVLILIVAPILTYFLIPLTQQIQFLLLGFILFGVWGLIDVLFTNAIKNNEKLKALQETFEWRLGKLPIPILINLSVLYLLNSRGIFTELTVWSTLIINITPGILLLLAIVGQFAVYAGEITDGLDGLMAGIFGLILASLAVLLLIQGQYLFIPFISLLIGIVVVDLYFNIPPARFWNGGPGAMPLAFSTFLIALLTGNLIAYFIMSSITWIIMASSMIQILSMKFFKKRVFKIAPLHHYFQAIGWPDYKVTMRFWLFTIVMGFLGTFVGLVI